MDKETKENRIFEHLIFMAKPVNDELFSFAYNIFSDSGYINLPEDRQKEVLIEISGVGNLKLADNDRDVHLMSAWNDLIDLEVPEGVRIAVMIRLMQIGQVFLHPIELHKWLPKNKVVSPCISGIHESLVKACATVSMMMTEDFGIHYDIANLVAIAKLVDKMEAGA